MLHYLERRKLRGKPRTRCLGICKCRRVTDTLGEIEGTADDVDDDDDDDDSSINKLRANISEVYYMIRH